MLRSAASWYRSDLKLARRAGSPSSQEWRNDSQDHLGPLDVGLRGGEPGVTALVGFARELELQGVLQDLMGAQRKIVERSGLLGEREDQLVHVGVQLVGDGCHRCRRLVLPQGVLEPEESGPARIIHALGQPVGAPVDLIVEVPEGVVGRAQAGVVEMGDQPGLLGLIQLPGIGQGPQVIGVGGQDGKTRRLPPPDTA